MKSTDVTRHTEITALAHKIWQERGNPTDQDLAIWLDAERQLLSPTPQKSKGAAVETHSLATHSESLPKDGQKLTAATASSSHAPLETNPHPIDAPHGATNQDSIQKQAARAPRIPTKASAVNRPTPESGKPLWSRPHSS